MKITIAIVSFLLLSLVAEGQFRVNKYPVFFSQYMNCHALYNPASISARSPLEVCAGSKRNMGNWSNFATYFAALSMDMPFKSPAYKSTGNTIGVRFTGDKEGVYLQQTKLYVAYAWHSKINENWRFSGGLEVGGFNYSAKGTYTTGDRSISNLDANVGIWIYRDGLHFGISGNQLLNSI